MGLLFPRGDNTLILLEINFNGTMIFVYYFCFSVVETEAALSSIVEALSPLPSYTVFSSIFTNSFPAIVINVRC